jgi:RecA/RadA recombinase
MALPTFEISGSLAPVVRQSTGLFSLDRALRSMESNTGMPMDCIYEIFGAPNIGKSSLSYYLAGVINKEARIRLCDLEKFDPDYMLKSLVTSKYHGNVTVIGNMDAKGKAKDHEDMLRELADFMGEPDTSAGILDSIGALAPVQEMEGEPTDANMGRRAKAVAAFTRRLVSNLNKPSPIHRIAFIINHVHGVIGGRGHVTAGGDTLKFLAAVRLYLFYGEIIEANDEPVAFITRGAVEKLKWGGRGKEFKFAIVPNVGISPGLTALVDCVTLKLATRESVVKLQGTSFGYISKLVDYARDGQEKKFEPFHEALQEYQKKLSPVAEMEESNG